MEQLLAHLVGDYVLQNHWMANRKTKEWLPAIVHVLLYGLPFLLLTQSPLALAVIVLTHLLIDRYRLAAYWVDFWGTGKEGTVTAFLMRARGFTRVDCMDGGRGSWATPSSLTMPVRYADGIPDAPPFLGVWLLILVDNTMHLSINFAALRWLA